MTTITAEPEVSTTAPTMPELRAARTVAEAALPGVAGLNPLGVEFNIPHGYRIPDSAPDYDADNPKLLVTKLGREDRTAEAAVLGRAVDVAVIRTPDGLRWIIDDFTATAAGAVLPVTMIRASGALVSDGWCGRAVSLAEGTLMAFSTGLVLRRGSVSGGTATVVEAVFGYTVGEAAYIPDTPWVVVELDDRPAPAAPFTGPSWVTPELSVPQGRSIHEYIDLLALEDATSAGDSTDSTGRLGRVWRARPSSDTQRWFAPGSMQSAYLQPDEDGESRYYRGAVINPAPEANQYYLFEDGTVARYLVTVWAPVLNSDGVTNNEPDAWWADTTEGAQANTHGRWVKARLTPQAGADADTAEAGLAYQNTISYDSPLLGMAVPGARLNPDLTEGQMYVYWAKNWMPGDRSGLAMAVTQGGDDLTVVPVQAYSVDGDGELRLAVSLLQYIETGGAFQRAYDYTEAVWAATAPVSLHTEIPYAIATGLQRTRERRAVYVEKLNELAENRGWCPEYEEVMGRIGFPGRNGRNAGEEHDFRAILNVSFTYSNSGPSSWMDTQVRHSIAEIPELELSELTFEGSGTVEVSVGGLTQGQADDADTDFIEGYISAVDVEAALGEILSEGSFDVTSWDLESMERDD